jgi:uncharacterized protein
MSRDFPDFVDPWKAAEGQRVFVGTMPLKRMERLSPLLVSTGGEAGFEACFYFDRQRNAIIKVAVKADLVLLCQRSLGPYTETVQRTSLLAVIRDIAEQDMMPANYEPLVLETGGRERGKLALLELVEDELLLALPQIPKNPAVDEIELSTDGEVRPPSDDKEEHLQRPFAGLAGMLEKS